MMVNDHYGRERAFPFGDTEVEFHVLPVYF
jgi:hypothetical protein